jgi:hypothetical protein
VRPVIFSLLASTDDLGNDKSSAEKENGAVHKDFKALAIAKVQPRNRYVPEKRGHRTAE